MVIDDLVKTAQKIHSNILLTKDNMKFRNKSRTETFSSIYEDGLWGGGI